MRTRLVCLLLVLILLCGCRSAHQHLFPADSGQMGPTDYPAWELKRDLERCEHHHYWSAVSDPWDEW